ncbi:STAS domain-containing protein [Streptomyces sp. NPDC046853]|uniref:STAS domain-containing protein n=1 Tax=Streptomyces sp. NPDC046853 TaxID=3154920 RepID=UPI0033C7233C
MTTPSAHRTTGLAVTSSTLGCDSGVLHLELHGYLEHGTCERFLAEATAQLAATPASLRTLRVNCADLGSIDSMGLSALLMLHRRTTTAGVGLHLHDRTAALDRMLTITGTLDHLAPERLGEADRRTRSDPMAYRHTLDDGIRAGQPETAAGPDQA